MNDNLNFIFTTKKVVIEGEHYVETTEGYEGQPAKWIRYGPIPENMVDEVVKSLHDTTSRFLAGMLFSSEKGVLLPAPILPQIDGKSWVETCEKLLANPGFKPYWPSDFTPPQV